MNVTNNKLFQIPLCLPPRSFNDCSDKVHPLTSLHRAVWNYQETAVTSSDVDLAKKVKALSEQKIAAYEGRFGWVLRKVSAFINWLKFGRAISCGELGLELSAPIIQADNLRKAEQQKRKECKTQIETDLRKTYKFKHSSFANLISSFLPEDKIEKWEDLSPGEHNHYYLTLSEPVSTLWVLDGIPFSVEFPKETDIFLDDQGVLSIHPLPITSEKNSSINSLRPTEDGKIEVNYTFNGKVKTAILPFSAFANSTKPALEALPVVDPMDDKFLNAMSEEFKNIWKKPSDQDFVTQCWSHLLAGVNKGRFTVLESGKKYRLELDEAVTGKMTALLGVSVLMQHGKEIEITIAKDQCGNHSFNFPKGGLSFEVTHPTLPTMGRPIDQIAVFSATKEAMIAVPSLKVSWIVSCALKKLAPERLDDYQFDMSQTLSFQETLGKLSALKWGE